MNELTKEGIENLVNFAKELNSICDKYISVYDDLSRIGNSRLNMFYKTYKTLSTNSFPCVYFIRNKYNNLVKIGSTKNPFKRFKELKSMCLNHFGMDNVLEIEGIIYIPSEKHSLYENILHKQYKEYNKHGEWFDLSKETIKNEMFPSNQTINGICVDYMCEDIKNDGFETVSFNRDIDIERIKHKVFYTVVSDKCLGRKSEKYQKMEKIVCDELGIKYEPVEDSIFNFSTKTFPIVIDLYNWCIVNRITFSAELREYIGHYKYNSSEAFFNIDFDNKFSYEDALDFQIEKYFNENYTKLNIGDSNAS